MNPAWAARLGRVGPWLACRACVTDRHGLSSPMSETLSHREAFVQHRITWPSSILANYPFRQSRAELEVANLDPYILGHPTSLMYVSNLLRDCQSFLSIAYDGLG